MERIREYYHNQHSPMMNMPLAVAARGQEQEEM